MPESFYEATTDDYRVALQAIKANRMRIEEETQMRTKEMKEKDRLRRIPKYRKVRTSPPCDVPPPPKPPLGWTSSDVFASGPRP